MHGIQTQGSSTSLVTISRPNTGSKTCLPSPKSATFNAQGQVCYVLAEVLPLYKGMEVEEVEVAKIKTKFRLRTQTTTK